MTRRRPITCLIGAAAAALAIAGVGCGGGGNDATAAAGPSTTAGGQPASVGSADDGKLGTILVDSKGRTLYLFKNDAGAKSTCFGECARDWPPLSANGQPTVDGAANASLVGTTTRSDGSPQVTYNGHPLYLYAGDATAGDTNGQGVSAFGAAWYVLSAAGNQVSGPASSSSGSGSVYGSG